MLSNQLILSGSIKPLGDLDMNNKLDDLISKSSGLRTCSSLRRSRSPKQVGEKDVELVVGASEKSQNSEKVKFGEVGLYQNTNNYSNYRPVRFHNAGPWSSNIILVI